MVLAVRICSGRLDTAAEPCGPAGAASAASVRGAGGENSSGTNTSPNEFCESTSYTHSHLRRDTRLPSGRRRRTSWLMYRSRMLLLQLHYSTPTHARPAAQTGNRLTSEGKVMSCIKNEVCSMDSILKPLHPVYKMLCMFHDFINFPLCPPASARQHTLYVHHLCKF